MALHHSPMRPPIYSTQTYILPRYTFPNIPIFRLGFDVFTASGVPSRRLLCQRVSFRMASCVLTTSRANVAMPTLARTTTQSVPRAGPRLSSSRFASGTRLYTTKSLGRCRPQQRQTVTMGIFGLGGPEIAVIAGVAVLIFGPSKIPGLGKEVGKAAKSFQQAAKEFENELKSGAEDTADKPPTGESTTKKNQQ